MKALSDFHKRKNGASYSYCKECHRSYLKDHYKQNKQYYVSKANKRNIRVKKENSDRILEYLKEHPCVDCGENNPIFLEFDHLRDRRLEVSRMYLYSWDTIMDEISKCAVRCVKCHRLKTYQQFGWKGLQKKVFELLPSL